jgi:hypothetical protein
VYEARERPYAAIEEKERACAARLKEAQRHGPCVVERTTDDGGQKRKAGGETVAAAVEAVEAAEAVAWAGEGAASGGSHCDCSCSPAVPATVAGSMMYPYIHFADILAPSGVDSAAHTTVGTAHSQSWASEWAASVVEGSDSIADTSVAADIAVPVACTANTEALPGLAAAAHIHIALGRLDMHCEGSVDGRRRVDGNSCWWIRRRDLTATASLLEVTNRKEPRSPACRKDRLANSRV